VNRGSMLPLVAGLLALTLTLVLGVSSVASLSVERHRLVALAETVSLRAAESFNPAELRLRSGAITPRLTSEAVRQVAINVLATTPHRHDELRLVRADSPDGLVARIVLSARWSPPFVSHLIPVSIPVRAEVASRAIIH
jgi:hypothetical protein